MASGGDDTERSGSRGGDERTQVARRSAEDAPTVVTDADSVPASLELADWDAQLHRIDRYTLLDRLGAGAFGVVRAAYDPELDRKVAIKLMRRGPADTHGSTSQAPTALVDEARMAAKLSHPNVVAIYDIGSLHRVVHRVPGAPPESLDGIYIVMEHLGGPSMRDWLAGEDGQRRGWSEILEVFLDAGRGLAAAHEHGMIHRDFKPGNLRFGSDGRVRVLDFGLARLVQEFRRGVEAVSGTPRYMAPEQHTGEPLDGRADQFSFCVSLWRCLYGTWPHEGESVKALGLAKHRPPAPPDDPRVPAWLGARLCRGLSPRPADRYPSMKALLEALSDDPQERRRRRMLGVGLGLVLLGGGYGLATLGDRAPADSCALPEGHFTGIWDDDVQARVAASFRRNGSPYAEAAHEEVQRELQGHLERWTERRTEVCRASIDRGERSIDAASRELECLDRQLRRVAVVASTLQQADDAVVLHAAELVSRLPPPALCRSGSTPEPGQGAGPAVDQDAVLALEDRIARAEDLAHVGDFEGSLAAADAVIAEATALGDDASRVRAMLVRTLALIKDSHHDDAITTAMDAHARAMALGDLQSAARAMVYLVSAHRVRGDYDEAELLARLAEGVAAQAGPAVQVDLAFQLGALAEDRSQWDVAFERLDHARALAESLYGPDHLQVGDIVIVQGIANSASRRDFDAALAHFRHARSIFERHYGHVHPRVASTYNNVGGVYFRQDQFDRALPEFERALEIYTQTHGDEHPLTMRALANLAVAEYKVGHVERGLTLTERVLTLRGAALGTNSPEYVSGEANLAAMLYESGRAREALSRLEHVYARTVEMHGAQGSPTIIAAGKLVAMAEALDEAATADHYGAIVLEGLAAVPDDDPERLQLMGYASTAAGRAGRWDEALTFAEQRRALAIERAGPTDAEVARAIAQIAEVLLELDRVEEAHTRLRHALSELEAADDADQAPARALPLHLALARTLRRQQQPARAREQYAWVLEHIQPSPGTALSRARAHLGLAELAPGAATRDEHARACLEVLATFQGPPSLRTRAQALLDGEGSVVVEGPPPAGAP